jgi:hypothetical protein
MQIYINGALQLEMRAKMAYPEPIPPLKGKQAERFLRNLENFRLTKEQMEFYREAINRKDKE